MIKLNILPGDRKKALKEKNFYAMANKKIFFLLSILFVYAILLTGESLYLGYELRLSAEAIEVFSKKEATVDKTIQEANKKIIFLRNLQQDSINWFDLFGYLGELKTHDIELNSISFNKLTNQAVISGFSPTRESLVSFLDKLKASTQFSDVDLPFSVLMNQKDINFEIKMLVKSYESPKNEKNTNK